MKEKKRKESPKKSQKKLESKLYRSDTSDHFVALLLWMNENVQSILSWSYED